VSPIQSSKSEHVGALWPDDLPRPKPAPKRPPGRLFTLDTLALKGITYSRNYLRRLWQAGKFPRPLYLSERRPAWTEAQLDEWIAEREAERDGGRVR
jgi:predicted DNA-binding transcriptional regulator AlpA